MQTEERLNKIENQLNILSNNFYNSNNRNMNLEQEFHKFKEDTQTYKKEISNKLDIFISILGNRNKNNKSNK